MLDWAVIVFPVVITALVFFAPAPKAGRKFSAGWRVAIAILGILTAFLAWRQQQENAREKRELRTELAKLRTVSPLRKQAADLAKELLDFYNEREHYNDRFKPEQVLSDKEAAAMKWYSETVSLYHANYERRILSILEEIHVATGMDVRAIQSDAKRVRYAPEVEGTATRLSAFAASLP